MATFYEIYQNYLQNPYGGDGYATGGRVGYAEGSNLYGGYSGNKISQVEDPLGLIQRLNKAGGNRTPYDNISYLPSEGGYVEWDGSSWTVTSPEMIEQRIKDWESVNYSPIQPPNTLDTPTEGSVSQEGVIPGFTKLINPDGATGNYNEFMYEGPDDQIYGAETYSSIAAGQYPNIYDPSKNTATEQTTPTEDFSDYLNTTTINTNIQTAPTVAEQMISPDDAMNQYDILNQMDEGQISSFDSIGNRLENIVNNPAIKGFTNFVTGSGNPFQDISQFTPSQQNVINQAIENAAKEGRTNITYADYPKTGVAQLADDGFSPMEYVKTLGSSIIGNPVDQIKTTLGQFAYDPQQQQIKDFYDFQKQSGNNLGTSYPININVSNPKASQLLRDIRERAPANIVEHINTAVGSLNPFQQQQYVNYAIQNPDQAITAAQQNKDFLAATQKNIAPAPASMADGGRVFYLQGGLTSLLG
jgi:hypothetical protein